MLGVPKKSSGQFKASLFFAKTAKKLPLQMAADLGVRCPAKYVLSQNKIMG